MQVRIDEVNESISIIRNAADESLCGEFRVPVPPSPIAVRSALSRGGGAKSSISSRQIVAMVQAAESRHGDHVAVSIADSSHSLTRSLL